MRGRKSGKWVEEFDVWLRTHKKNGKANEPLPPCRDLAVKYGVVHTTIFRHLERLEKAGRLWKADNGRFYFPEARASVQRLRPVACLFRKIENWSLLYQEMMEGIAQGCETLQIGSLLWHEENLVRHLDPELPPLFAEPYSQRESLARFAERYGADVGGIILDHVWSDEALASLPEDLQKRSVVLCRPSPHPIHSIKPDFQAAANLALVHLLTAGYEKIHAVRPFSQDLAIDYCLESLEAVASSSVPGARMGATLSAETPSVRRDVIRSLAKSRHRTALVFPEDNVANLFWQDCQAAGISCPSKIGLISIQGTRAASLAQITHIRFDYSDLGKRAVKQCLHPTAPQTQPPPILVPGVTTIGGQNFPALSPR